MKTTFSEITALILGTMFASRMVFMMLAPKNHAPLQRDLYNQRRAWIKRGFYILVAILCAWLLISETSVVYFILAWFAVGALYDLLFTYYDFPDPSIIETRKQENRKIPVEIPSLTSGKIRVYIGIPAVLVVGWLYWFVFTH